MCVYTQGNTLAVVSAEDLIKVLAPKIKGLLCETAKAFVERETGANIGHHTRCTSCDSSFVRAADAAAGVAWGHCKWNEL